VFKSALHSAGSLAGEGFSRRPTWCSRHSLIFWRQRKIVRVPRHGRAARKDRKVSDPGDGVNTPTSGAFGAELRSDSGSRPENDKRGFTGNDLAAKESRDAPQRKRKKRKRRLRRKVYARDNRTIGSADGPAITPSIPDEKRPILLDCPAQVSPPQARSSWGPVYAALDLGTNNCRLLVAVPTRPGQFRVVDAFSRIVRLGEGLSATGRLSDQAMERALEALQICADKLGTRNIARSRLIATEACRSATNGAHFIRRVEAETGLRLEIIDRETEARLAVSGCGSLVERSTDAVVLFDIGGGSSEIALIDVSRRRSHRLANHIISWTSLPVGVVSLAERFGGRHVTREVFDAMVGDVSDHLMAFEGRHGLAHLASGPRFHLLGTSGTVTTLAGIHLGLERYDRRRVDGLWMDAVHVDRMIETLLGWKFEERVANPCIGADRADLVLAGCAILQAIREIWPSERLRVADRGLREGILSELMLSDGAWRRGHPGRSS
jgi:exopolyphosphatase/guanosine-5'-triphosphate,3'-diphosphate pyrophosphatase